MKQAELTTIRLAIADTSEPYTHGDPAIQTILDLVGSQYLTIAHFLLGDAVALSDPTVPTAPTFDDAPSAPSLSAAPDKSTTIGLEKWRTTVANEKYLADLETRKWTETKASELSKYTGEISSYRAQQSTTQIKLELRKAHAQLYLDLAKDFHS